MSQSKTQSATITINTDAPGPSIDPNIYGHFAEHLGRCIYEGIWVGEDSPIPNTRGIRNDVLEALRALNIPVIRWPGGCFADEYHWKDGIGPREKRPSMINTHWGGVVENNHFGTHEFMDLVELLGCDAYICGNVGSGTVREMMEWVEYLTSGAESPMANLRRINGREDPWRVRFFGVGNESWACGGNMRPEYYADEYRRYNTFVKNYDLENPITRIACGPNEDDYDWTETIMDRVPAEQMNELSLHWYTRPTGQWKDKGSSTDFAEDQWFSTLQHAMHMQELIEKHSAIMDRYDPEKRVGLVVDEWGTWYNVEPGTNPRFLYQQNTIRDAIVAGLHFHVFHRFADRITMANIAQTVNVLQAMILTDGPRMLRTPTYWIFEMFKVHQGGEFLPITVEAPDYEFGASALPGISASATRHPETGATSLSIINLHPSDAANVRTKIDLSSMRAVGGRILTAPAMNTHNTFDEPSVVEPAEFADFQLAEDQLNIALPSKSVVVLEM